MGVTRTARTLLRLNQVHGFDCQGCAWPDPDPEHRHTAEFCENGAKAVAEEATTDHIRPEFFRDNSIEDLAKHTDYWLGAPGTHRAPDGAPTRRHPLRADHLGGGLRADRAIAARRSTPPTRRSSTPPARPPTRRRSPTSCSPGAFGTNNLPDCSNMCHESTSVALAEAIGIGKGSVALKDIYEAELIVISGQNPGTNHPRMLSALEKAKQNGAKILTHQPAARGRADEVHEPADPARPERRRHRPLRSAPARAGSTATWRCGRRSARCCWRSTRTRRTAACSTANSSPSTRAGSTTGPRRSATSTGTWSSRRRA